MEKTKNPHREIRIPVKNTNTMKHATFMFAAVLLMAIQSCTTTPEPLNISQWRGPDRNGIFQETDLLDVWTDEGPELLWIYEGLGRGFAGPVISPKGIFINGENNGESFTVGLDLDGNELWKSPNGNEFEGKDFSANYPGARSTPTVVNDLVYATSGTGQLSCYDADSGKVIWTTDLMHDMGGFLGIFGFSESPAVDEEYLYCFPGGQKDNVVAFDRINGEVAWSSAVLKDTFAYGSPILLDLPEKEVLVGTSRYHIHVLDKSNGELLSSYKLEGYQYDGEHCNSLVYEDGYLYFVANDIPGQGSMKLKLADDGSEITEVWRNPEVMNNFGGFLVVEGDIFTTMKGNKLIKIDGESGVVADSIKAPTGSIVAADGKFFVYGYSGFVNLVSYTEGKLEVESEMRIKDGTGHHFSHPVIAGGIMYIRRGDALMAFGIN